MKWKNWRTLLVWICLLLGPANIIFWTYWVLVHREPGYDFSTWFAIGVFNGVVIGGLVALALRAAIYIVDRVCSKK